MRFIFAFKLTPLKSIKWNPSWTPSRSLPRVAHKNAASSFVLFCFFETSPTTFSWHLPFFHCFRDIIARCPLVTQLPTNGYNQDGDEAFMCCSTRATLKLWSLFVAVWRLGRNKTFRSLQREEGRLDWQIKRRSRPVVSKHEERGHGQLYSFNQSINQWLHHDVEQ